MLSITTNHNYRTRDQEINTILVLVELNSLEFDDVEDYEEEFDELVKSDEKPIEPPSK
jgi:hypothetical protein